MPASRTLGFILAAVLGLSGCGDDTPSQIDARDRATTKSCDMAQFCGLIKADGTSLYTNRDDCETKQRAIWQGQWPVADCDGRIEQTQLNACLATLEAVQCDSAVIEWAAAYAGVCSKTRVCSAGSPG